MKKLAFVFAAIVAVSFASCGQKTASTESADSTVCCADTTACDSCPKADTCALAADSLAVDTVVAE